MGCGCSSFDGENERDGMEFSDASNPMLNANGRDGMEFSDESNPFLNADGDELLMLDEDFVVEDDDFDNFLTKKARERAKRRKQLRAEGLSRKEARKKAKEEIPNQPIGDAINEVSANLQSGQLIPKTEDIQSNTQDILDNANNQGGTGDDGTGDDEQGMGMGTKIGIGVLVLAIVGVGGYLIMKKRK
jgi:hypothetical protein